MQKDEQCFFPVFFGKNLLRCLKDPEEDMRCSLKTIVHTARDRQIFLSVSFISPSAGPGVSFSHGPCCSLFPMHVSACQASGQGSFLPASSHSFIWKCILSRSLLSSSRCLWSQTFFPFFFKKRTHNNHESPYFICTSGFFRVLIDVLIIY